MKNPLFLKIENVSFRATGEYYHSDTLSGCMHSTPKCTIDDCSLKKVVLGNIPK